MGQPAFRAELYRRLVTIRRCEEALSRVFDQGLSFGTVHLCIGQEAVPVGVVAALGPDDVVTSNHRGHGHFVARTDDVEGLVAEVCGRATGAVGGWGGSQHLHGPGFYSNGVTGGMVPVATGMALAEHELRTGRVVAAFHGDGALGQGVVYEAWNLAALWHLPVVFVLEDNRYAMSTPAAQAIAGDPLVRARGFGLSTAEVDGQDAEAVRDAAAPLVRAARRGDGPALLLCRTYRQCGHSRSDQREYRTREEEAAWAARDPLDLAGAYLEAGERAEIDARAAARVEAAVSAAFDAPFPALEAGQVEALQGYPGPDAPAPAAGPEEPGATYQQSVRAGLAAALRADPAALLLGEDLEDPYGGAFKVTRGLSTELPDRVRNTPLSEAVLAGLATGAALRGLRPIVEVMFSDFLSVAADQLVNHACKFRAMYGGRASVPLVVRTPAGGWRGYGATHSQCGERLLLSAPGLTVAAPGLHHDPGRVLQAAAAHDGPVLVVEHKLLYPRPLVPAAELEARGLHTWTSDGEAFPTLHVANAPRGLAALAVVSYGAVVELVHEALGRLTDDTPWELVLPSRLRPLPLRTLARTAARAGRLLVVEEGPTPWGWGAEVAAAVGEAAFEALEAPVLRVGATDLPIANSRPLEEALLPTADDVHEALLELLE